MTITVEEIRDIVKDALKNIREGYLMTAMVELNSLDYDAVTRVSAATAHNLKAAAGWLKVPNVRDAKGHLKDALITLPAD